MIRQERCIKAWRIMSELSLLKTIYLNFRTLSFSEAIHLPIVVSRHVKIRGVTKGSIKIKKGIKPFMILFGFGGSEDLRLYNSKRSVLMCRNGGTIVFTGGFARFSPHFSLLVDSSFISFGNGFTCNNGCSFSSVNGITFGDDCLIGGNVVVRDSDGHQVINNDSTAIIENRDAKVEIGDHVWICNNCSILKGVKIASNNIISYDTLCTKSVEHQHCLIAGHPGNIIRNNIDWKR